jgi:hypothetical protein
LLKVSQKKKMLIAKDILWHVLQNSSTREQTALIWSRRNAEELRVAALSKNDPTLALYKHRSQPIKLFYRWGPRIDRRPGLRLTCRNTVHSYMHAVSSSSGCSVQICSSTIAITIRRWRWASTASSLWSKIYHSNFSNKIDHLQKTRIIKSDQAVKWKRAEKISRSVGFVAM